MARQVVRYLLEGDGTVPAFVADGGYFSIGHEMVGISVDESARHVPATVVRMSLADLQAWVDAFGPKDRDGNPLNRDDVIAAWLEQVGFSFPA